jgi:predicted AAA+ superfamily ATPase
MRAVCLRLGQLINQTELGRDVALPQPTVHRWLNLLEASYQLVRLPAYSVNRTKRLIKAPKLYWSDTGLALYLSGEKPGGPHLENLVLCDLLAWRDSDTRQAEVLYWRTATGEEVDFVIEVGNTLLPIEVKATDRPRTGDVKHLLSFREEYGRRCRPGLLLHTGTKIEWLAPGVLAAPWWAVL